MNRCTHWSWAHCIYMTYSKYSLNHVTLYRRPILKRTTIRLLTDYTVRDVRQIQVKRVFYMPGSSPGEKHGFLIVVPQVSQNRCLVGETRSARFQSGGARCTLRILEMFHFCLSFFQLYALHLIISPDFQ